MSSILSYRNSVARKRYRCDQCNQIIQWGEEYNRQVHIGDGLITCRSHLECDQAAHDLWVLQHRDSDEGVNLREDVDKEDWPWLVWEYPVVAARLGIPDNTLPVLMHKRLMQEQTNMSKKFPNEKDVKKHIKALLDKHGWFWFMPPANGFGQTGISDILAIKAHVFMAIEAKYLTKVTDMQKGFLSSIDSEGGMAFVVSHKNIESLEAWLDAYDRACLAGAKGQEPAPEDGAMMINAIKELTDPWR